MAKGSRDLGFEVSGLGSRAYGFCGSSDSSDVGFRAEGRTVRVPLFLPGSRLLKGVSTGSKHLLAF